MFLRPFSSFWEGQCLWVSPQKKKYFAIILLPTKRTCCHQKSLTAFSSISYHFVSSALECHTYFHKNYEQYHQTLIKFLTLQLNILYFPWSSYLCERKKFVPPIHSCYSLTCCSWGCVDSLAGDEKTLGVCVMLMVPQDRTGGMAGLLLFLLSFSLAAALRLALHFLCLRFAASTLSCRVLPSCKMLQVMIHHMGSYHVSVYPNSRVTT